MISTIIKKNIWFAWFFCAISLFYIGKDRLINAHLWAEDGKFFLEYALQYGASAIFQEYSGYYHIIPHLIVQILNKLLPVYFIPTAIVVVTYLIYAAVFAQFARKEYRDYIESDVIRFALALTGCLWLSGRVEVLGNLANLHWVLFLYLWLIVMRPARYAIKWWEVVLMILCIFSAGEAVLITPLLLLRIYYAWNDNKSISQTINYHKTDIVILFVLFLSVVLNLLNTLEFSGSLPVQHHTVINWQEFFEGLQQVFLSSLFIYPWLDSDNYQHHYQLLTQNYFLTPILLITVLLIVFVVLQFFLYKKKQHNMHVMAGILCLLALPILTWLVRPQSLAHYNHNILFSEWWGTRYTFVLGVIGLFFWTILLYRLFFCLNRSLAVIIVFLFFGVYAYQHLAITEIKAYGTQYNWQESAALLHQSMTSGCPKEVVVPIYPEGWKMTYLSDSRKVCP